MIPAMTLFALLIGLGASLGLWQVARSAPLNQTGRWVDAGIGVLAGMLVGARLAYASIHTAYFAERPLQIFAVWQGGLSGWGAVAGGLVAAFGVALLLRQSLRFTLDRLCPLVTPLAVLGWLACGQAGCAYGPRLAATAWLGLPMPDEWGRVLLRFPLQPVAALLLLGYNGLIAAGLSGPQKVGCLAHSGLLWPILGYTRR